MKHSKWKMSGKNVLYVLNCIPVVTLIRWNSTVIWLPNKMCQAAFFFQKTQKLDASCFCNDGKNAAVFFWQVWGCNYPRATGRKYCLFHKGPNSIYTKDCFPLVSDLCKDIPRRHCTTTWEKLLRENVLWVVPAIPVVTLISRSCTVR